MKTPEQRAAERESRELSKLTSGIAGRSTEDLRPPQAPVPKQIDWFKPHPANSVFDTSKSATYWRDLKRDIREAGRIIDPVIALPDGTLIEGHSRIRVAKELATEGINLGRIPTVILDLAPEDAERRVYLGNLSRFELDEDTRLTLYAKVWPDYYIEAKPGRPNKGDTVSPPIRRADIAAATGKSERQVKRDRAIIQEAAQRARAKGKPAPDTEEIREARAKASAKRKEKGHRPLPYQAIGIVVELTPSDVKVLLSLLKSLPDSQGREITEKIQKATRTARSKKK